jgi:hypothetical protein
MSLYINTMVATEHRNQLIREAQAWRRGRVARRSARAVRQVAPSDAVVYCNRAAGLNLRNAS